MGDAVREERVVEYSNVRQMKFDYELVRGEGVSGVVLFRLLHCLLRV